MPAVSTQALAGAAIAQVLAPSSHMRAVTLLSTGAAVLPDADALGFWLAVHDDERYFFPVTPIQVATILPAALFTRCRTLCVVLIHNATFTISSEPNTTPDRLIV